MSRRDEAVRTVGAESSRKGERHDAPEDGKPFRIAAVPTVRLSEESSRAIASPPWTSSDLPRFTSRAVRPKPPTRRETLRRLLGRGRSGPRGSYVVTGRGRVLAPPVTYRRTNFTRRVRERAMLLFLFTLAGALLAWFTPLGLLVSVLGLALSWAELKVGWTQLSRMATGFVWGAIAAAVVGILTQATIWIAHLFSLGASLD